MPYSSVSINHYQGHLIAFGGFHCIERPHADKPVGLSVSLIHVYNPCVNTWDCVGNIPYQYELNRSVHVRDNKILFIGGLTGTCKNDNDDDIVTTCLTLTLSP